MSRSLQSSKSRAMLRRLSSTDRAAACAAALSVRRLYPSAFHAAQAQPIKRLEPSVPPPNKFGSGPAAYPPNRYRIK